MKSKGVKMERHIFILPCLFLLLMAPSAAPADCFTVGPFDNFIVQGGNTVILYNGSVAVAKMEVDCPVRPTSRIRLLKDYLCDGDPVRIDDETCSIASLRSLSED